nr:MAG TPA: hypothetical protein [Caudoviricetes sp.]
MNTYHTYVYLDYTIMKIILHATIIVSERS